MKLRIIGFIFIFAAVTLLITQVVHFIQSQYDWSKNYNSHWELADKSSSLPAKAKHISNYISQIENGDFAAHDAFIFTTPNNSFEENFNALKTLLTRLKEIEGMDPQSFQYNTAIQQITAQEQGEAREMLSVLKGCYIKKNYPMVWWGLIVVISWITLICTGIIFITADS